MSLTALLTLPIDLHCQTNLLGAEFPAKINGIDVNISFPRKNEEVPHNRHEYLAPPLGADRWERNNEAIHWGEIIGIRNSGAAVSCLSVQIPSSHEENTTARMVIDGISRWVTALLDYCALTSRQDTGIPIVRNPFMYGKVEFTPPIDIPMTTKIEIVLPDGEHFISIENFRDAISFASSNKELHLEYQMILSALDALHAGKNRHAVVDACSAIELCVVKQLKYHCRKKCVDDEKYLDQYRSFGKRLHQIRKIDKTFPFKDVDNIFVSLRNDIMHNREIYPSNEITSNFIVNAQKCLSHYHRGYY